MKDVWNEILKSIDITFVQCAVNLIIFLILVSLILLYVLP